MRRFLIDTNVISEAIKPTPNASATEWLSHNAADSYLASITIEELRFGEFMMPEGKKRRTLKDWIDALLVDFAQSIISFDAAAATVCAHFHEMAISVGRTPTIEDLMVAAIAQAKNLTLVTRNVRDFDYLPVDLLDPFSD